MGELLIALAPIVLIGLIYVVATFVPLQVIAITSLAVMSIGTITGVPFGLWYHVVLRRELLRVGPLPKGWLWHPHRHHDLLDARARAHVRMWFMAGGAGFLLIVLGASLGLLTLALYFRGGAGPLE